MLVMLKPMFILLIKSYIMKRLTLTLLTVLITACQPKTNTPTPAESVTGSKLGAPNTTLTKTYIDPGPGFSQAVVVEANGIKTIHISGQVGSGTNFETQLRDALNNLMATLKHSGATFKNVVKYNTYIVNYQPAYLDTFRTVRKELLGDTDMPASTLVGVTALGRPEWGVEIEATAVVKIP